MISGITVGGYKSIATKQTALIRPLTIFAGANSSGKSSLMQPVLLLKQTLNVGYAPAPLLLNGPNVKLSSFHDIRPKHSTKGAQRFSVRFDFDSDAIGFVEMSYSSSRNRRISIDYMTFDYFGSTFTLREGMSSTTLRNFVRRFFDDDELAEFDRLVPSNAQFLVVPSRGFLDVSIEQPGGLLMALSSPLAPSPESWTARRIENLIHLPGLRGNPERTYPSSSTDDENYPGTFEHYTASLLRQWQIDREVEKLNGVGADLRALGLTSRVHATMRSDSAVEILVARALTRRLATEEDLVNIADVGIGVSQALPLVVALHAAEPYQFVYVEQPELHLHPRSQAALADILMRAVKRRVYVIAETHSPLLLLAIQTLVARQKLDPSAVALNWFSRNSAGQTIITSGELDDAGTFGEWPADFSDVELRNQTAFIKSSALANAAS